MLLEISWWAGYNGIHLVRFGFRMWEILSFKCFGKVPYTFVRSVNLKSFFASGEGTPHWGSSWIPSGSTHGLKRLSGTVFSFQFPVGATETVPTNAPVGSSVHSWMVAVFHPPPDPALTHRYKSNRFDFFFDFSLTFWILTTLTPSYLLTYVPYSPS
jgi:hypothetical protein